jgi:hypothetical protein
LKALSVVIDDRRHDPEVEAKELILENFDVRIVKDPSDPLLRIRFEAHFASPNEAYRTGSGSSLGRNWSYTIDPKTFKINSKTYDK